MHFPFLFQVRRISQLVLKREHAFINTVDTGCPDSNSKVHCWLLYHNMVRELLVYEYTKSLFST